MGPLFWYEMRRLGRRGRFYWLRMAFLVALAFLCWRSYETFEQRLRQEANFSLRVGGQIYYGAQLTNLPADRIAQAVARMGHEFLLSFLAVEAVIVMLLAPLLVASALEEERRQRTLDLLLTTHLRPGHIIFGKALPRVLLLGTLVLGGLALPAIAQLQGGIDAQLVLASTLVLLSGLLAQAAVTMWHSARGSSLRTVLMVNYLLLIAWLLIGLAQLPAWMKWLDDALIWINAPRMLRFLSAEFLNSGILGHWPWKLALVHTLVHGTLAAFLMWRAGRLLRGSLERARTTPIEAGTRRSFWARTRPAFDQKRPLLWKERGATVRAGSWGWLIMAGVVFATFAWTENRFRTSGRYYYHGHHADELMILGLLTLLVPMFLAALYAAWVVRREAERSTWDSLLVTPIHVRDLMRAKWQACLLSAGRPIIVLSGALGIFLLLIGWRVQGNLRYHDFHLPRIVMLFGLLTGNVVAACALAASVGLLMSVVCRTGLRAMVATFVVLATLAGMPLAFRRQGIFDAHNRAAEFLLLATDFTAFIAWLGAPLILILLVGVFSLRVRRWLDVVFRAVAIPFVTALLLQLPIILFLATLAALNVRFDLDNSIPPMSPIGFVIVAADEVVYGRQTSSPFFVLAIALNALLAYVIYRVACWVAARHCGRIDEAPRRRRLPLPPLPKAAAKR